jgi:hypothetical protein
MKRSQGSSLSPAGHTSYRCRSRGYEVGHHDLDGHRLGLPSLPPARTPDSARVCPDATSGASHQIAKERADGANGAKGPMPSQLWNLIGDPIRRRSNPRAVSFPPSAFCESAGSPTPSTQAR